MQVLSENFITELLKSCISNQNVLETISVHLEEAFLPSDEHKKLWRHIKESFELTNHTPSIGILNERLKDDPSTLKLLLDVKRCKLIEVDNLFPHFETFIKEVRFISLHQETGKLWNAGNQDAAIRLLAKESEEINNFSLKEGLYGKVFLDFEKRQEERKNKEREDITKVPFGIHALDYFTYGGINLGTSALVLGRSGTGKSTALRWFGINAARHGLRVIHFQVESSERETMDAYDSAWTSSDLAEMEFGSISKDKIQKVKNINKDIIDKGADIFVIAPSQFDSLSIESCKDTIEEIEKNYGKVSLCLFDNLELFTVKGRFSGSEQGERIRRETIANKITNLAVMHNMACIATTQANDIRPERFNNPDFVMTRSEISEFKGLIRPFSVFFSLNQTFDEYEAGVCRIYIDKLRKYKSGMTLKIYQSLTNSRFYDSHRTLSGFWDANNKKSL